MFSEASNFVKGVDTSLVIILGISLFFLIGITVTMVYFVIRYRKQRNPKASNIKGNNTLEVIWTVIPTLLVLVMFYFGWAGFKPMRQVPADAMVIKAHGQMWSWSFEYENGKRSPDLVIPIDQPVKLELISHDVIHSLYIPAYRIKEDVVPGKNNWMWFKGQEVGEYDIFCAEYCGQRHAYMLSRLFVKPAEEYEQWYAEELGVTTDPPGLAILKQNACLSCHSLDGTVLVGPSFKGIYGKKEIVLINGAEQEITVDDSYIASSIYEPNAQVVKGFTEGLMISYKQTVSEEDLEMIIEYLKGL